MKYTVSFKETNYGGVTVEASNAEEAKMLAEQEYYNGNVYWKDSDLELRSVKKEIDRGDAR